MLSAWPRFWGALKTCRTKTHAQTYCVERIMSNKYGPRLHVIRYRHIASERPFFFLPIGKNTGTRYEVAAGSTVVVAKNDYDDRYNIIVLGSFAKNTVVIYTTPLKCIRKPMYTSELKVLHIIILWWLHDYSDGMRHKRRSVKNERRRDWSIVAENIHTRKY